MIEPKSTKQLIKPIDNPFYFYIGKFKHQYGIGNFLGKQGLLKLTPVKLDSLNRLTLIKAVKIIKELPYKKAAGPDGFTGGILSLYTQTLMQYI